MQAILNQWIDNSFDQLIAYTQAWVQLESTLDEDNAGPGAPFGPGIRKALEFGLETAAAMGFTTRNFDGYAGYAQLGDSGEVVGILAHVDVVPAVGDWVVPPYSGQIVDGRLYGRGAVDDKGPAMACLYAMKAIAETGLPISHRARLILGTDEETLARGIAHYLQEEGAPSCGFSPDAEFPIIHAEKGTIRFQFRIPCADEHIVSLQAGTRLNIVPDRAIAIVRDVTAEQIQAAAAALGGNAAFYCREKEGELRIEAHGVASHACYPEDGVNAIQAMLCLLDRLFPQKDTPLLNTIHQAARMLAMETDGTSAGLACSDKVSGALTLNTAIIQVGREGGVVKFDIRYPVTHDGQELCSSLENLAGELGGVYELIQHKPPLYVEKNRPFIAKLQQAYEEMTGQEPRCISIGGGTYCRYVPNTVSFGPVFPGQKELAHQCNEYLALEDLRQIAKIYAQAIYNLIR